ncbi:FAD:protein FMN transferase [Alicyclobacillus fodiniaquatilis]|uniref:FAD:protein FMN transferase n=1 Tax=Alicyclobacillus fodiniaquatilis TaxID=1661150 RepID=A0ABW4JI01_9BACL
MASRRRKRWTQARLLMGTIVTIQVSSSEDEQAVLQSLERAFAAFRAVEAVCSRFDPTSELMRLTRTVGAFVPVSEILFQTVQFALAVAHRTNGLFDPTVGRRLAKLGFHQHYLTRQSVQTVDGPNAHQEASYQDVEISTEKQAICLHNPLTLDLGAVAKGFAVDLAAQELRRYEGFIIDAGGDLYVSGTNDEGAPWLVGIRDPFVNTQTICTLEVHDMAVCTSGGYERRSTVDKQAHHIIYPHTNRSPVDVASCTVLAPFAMLADAFSTVGMLLDIPASIDLFDSEHLSSLIITNDKEIHLTGQMEEFLDDKSSSKGEWRIT